MVALQNLFEVLPILALLHTGLSGIQEIPSVSATHNLPRKDHHRHLATRARLGDALGAHQKARVIRRGADGKQCRVRGSSPSFSAQSASAVIALAPSTSSAAVTTSAVPVTWVETAVTAAPTQATTSATDNEDLNAVPSQSSSSAPAASSASSGGSSYSGGGSGWANTGSKFGLAWPNGDWWTADQPDYIGNYIGSKASWYYTWSPFSVSSADKLGLEFVPMLWGPNQVSDFGAQQASWPNTVKNALFFNEPNEGSQCNVAASDSVSYWMNNMVPLRSKGIAIGGAATTNAPSGLQWVKDAITACTGAGNSVHDCTPNFVPIHWYATSAGNLQQYAQNFHDETGLDVWITEYACQNFNGGAQCDNGQVWSLHQTMAAWFDQQDWVKRYSPFGVMQNMQGVNQDNALMSPDGSITALGSWYISSA